MFTRYSAYLYAIFDSQTLKHRSRKLVPSFLSQFSTCFILPCSYPQSIGHTLNGQNSVNLFILNMQEFREGTLMSVWNGSWPLYLGPESIEAWSSSRRQYTPTTGRRLTKRVLLAGTVAVVFETFCPMTFNVNTKSSRVRIGHVDNFE